MPSPLSDPTGRAPGANAERAVRCADDGFEPSRSFYRGDRTATLPAPWREPVPYVVTARGRAARGG